VKAPNRQFYQKAAWLAGAILLTASISGFFMGLQQTGSQISMTRPISLVSRDPERRAMLETSSVPVAVSYAKQDWLKEGPNAQWRNSLTNLVQPSMDASVLTNVSEDQRAAALIERRTRRAFDGAPPTVPHPIPQDSAAACLACHGPGLTVKDKTASKISHSSYASCTQCHVPAGGTGLPLVQGALAGPFVENEFIGVAAPLKGARAWPQAPPTLPHGTLMRSDCLSCHGPRGLFGLRTPHPDRQSCLQCHAPNAELDQHKFAAFSAPSGSLSHLQGVFHTPSTAPTQ
jgi:cytochrome c-type protein NapB